MWREKKMRTCMASNRVTLAHSSAFSDLSASDGKGRQTVHHPLRSPASIQAGYREGGSEGLRVNKAMLSLKSRPRSNPREIRCHRSRGNFGMPPELVYR